MLDPGGFAFLDGDPLGLRELEESLVWQTNGPLPDWLDGAEPNDEYCNLTATAATPISKSAPAVADATPLGHCQETSITPAPAEAAPPSASPRRDAPLVAEHVASGTTPLLFQAPADGLLSIDEIVRFVESPASTKPVEAVAGEALFEMPVAGRRRRLSADEGNEASLCLLLSAARQLWAVPLVHVAQVARPTETNTAIDLYERLEGRKRRDAGIAVTFENSAVLIVDQLIGTRTLNWAPQPQSAAEPDWVLGRAELGDQAAFLLDWQLLTTS